MNYRIDYGPACPAGFHPPASRHKKLIRSFFRFGILAAGLLLCGSIPAVRSFFLPGPETRAGFSVFLSAVGSGTPVKEAFTAFCRELIACVPLA